MLTIATCGLKGGIGKSVITVELATALHAAGHRTLIVDADAQASCALWAAKAAELGHAGPPVVAIAGKTLRRDLAQVTQGFDVVCIDSPPQLAHEARAAMLVSDLVLLPCGPSAVDLWALAETIKALADARDMRPELRAAVVFNKATKTSMSRAAEKALETMPVAVLDARLGYRVAFPEAWWVGQGVTTHAPSSDAAREVRSLVRAVLAAVSAEQVAA